MKIINYYSPNFNKKERSHKSIKFIVLHYTGMQSERESIKRLTNSRSKVSSHYLITINGRIYKLVDEKRIAWHAGKSCWGRYKNLNKNSLGIELVNKGHQFGYTNFKKKQIKKLIEICKKLRKKYKIKSKNIIGHSDIAPLRKNDPGEKFPWKYLAKKKIGIWHNFNSKFLKQYRRKKIFKEKEFIKNLGRIGYSFSYKKKFQNKIVKAFQRHYRKELINGIIDQECSIIAKKIAKIR